mgnify:CR=1 FL=1
MSPHFYTPRQRIIICIKTFRGLTTIVALKKDEEILVNYQMTLARSPEWYRQVWLAWMRKTKDDAAIQR